MARDSPFDTMNKLNFTAIDVETSIGKSICQIGIVVVEDGKIVKEFCQLVKPKGNKYNHYNTQIHGITPEDTLNSPSLPEIWEEVKEYLQNAVIVAHNAAFDMSVLESECEKYHLKMPKYMSVVCTYNLTGVKLKDACRYYGIEMEQHHNALSDAKCCAELFINYLTSDKPLPCEDSSFEVEKDNDIIKTPESFEFHEKLTGDVLVKCLDGADPDNPFYDKKVVITGVFPISRSELADKLKCMGADINVSISKCTDIVLVGEDAGPKKIEKI